MERHRRDTLHTHGDQTETWVSDGNHVVGHVGQVQVEACILEPRLAKPMVESRRPSRHYSVGCCERSDCGVLAHDLVTHADAHLARALEHFARHPLQLAVWDAAVRDWLEEQLDPEVVLEDLQRASASDLAMFM